MVWNGAGGWGGEGYDEDDHVFRVGILASVPVGKGNRIEVQIDYSAAGSWWSAPKSILGFDPLTATIINIPRPQSVGGVLIFINLIKFKIWLWDGPSPRSGRAKTVVGFRKGGGRLIYALWEALPRRS